MGIRTRCPNGHDLHVKAFLAGQLGICPQCGAKVLIPSQTDAPGVFQPSGGEDRSVSIRAASVAPPASADANRAVEREPAPAATPPDRRGYSPSDGPADPISESPHSLWYVRPPSGEQHGPTDGATLRRWMAEGRLTNDTLVWREGWSDWQTAGSTFGSLVNGSAAEVGSAGQSNASPKSVEPASAPVVSVASERATAGAFGADHPASGDSLATKTVSRRGQRRSKRIALAMLVAAVAVLLPIAVYVIVRG